MSEDEIQGVTPYIFYRWDCPHCGAVMEIESFDTAEEAQCENCNGTVVFE